MAHLPEDNLPGEFDVIIDGTGAPECVRSYSLICISLSCGTARSYSMHMHVERPANLTLNASTLGLVQSLLAASLARVGKSILHLDK